MDGVGLRGPQKLLEALSGKVSLPGPGALLPPGAPGVVVGVRGTGQGLGKPGAGPADFLPFLCVPSSHHGGDEPD